MRKTILFFLLFFTLKTVYGQFDKNHNPVFKSEIISKEKLDGFELQSTYYPISSNISNRESFLYVNDNPSFDDYLKFAMRQQSYLFVVYQGDTVLFGFRLIQQNIHNQSTFHYAIFNNSKHTSIQLPCNVTGEITEKRADELLKLPVDYSKQTTSISRGDSLLFNGTAYKIQPYDQLKAEVIEIAKRLLKEAETEKK